MKAECLIATGMTCDGCAIKNGVDFVTSAPGH